MTVQRWLIWGFGIIALLGLVIQLSPILTPFAMALVLAYVLNPLVDRLHRIGRVPRAVSSLLVVVLVLLTLIALVALLTPVVVHEWPVFRQQFPALMDWLNARLVAFSERWGGAVRMDLQGIKPWLLQYLDDNTETALRSALLSLKWGGSWLLALVGNLVLLPVVLYYFLLDWHALTHKALGLFPLRVQPQLADFFREADTVLGHYMRGQALVMAVLAVFYGTALWAFGLDLAWPIGLFTGLAVFIPYVGFGLGLFLAALVGAVQFLPVGAGAHWATMLVVVFGGGQLLESFFLTPRLIGERIGLHPLMVIFALLALGQLLGFVGVLMALPLAAVGLVAFRRLRARYRDSDFYRGH